MAKMTLGELIRLLSKFSPDTLIDIGISEDGQSSIALDDFFHIGDKGQIILYAVEDLMTTDSHEAAMSDVYEVCGQIKSILDLLRRKYL